MAKLGHFDHLLRLLSLEAAAEAQQLAEQARKRSGPEAERSGKCLVKLVIRDQQPAFGGRVVLTLIQSETKQNPCRGTA